MLRRWRIAFEASLPAFNSRQITTATAVNKTSADKTTHGTLIRQITTASPETHGYPASSFPSVISGSLESHNESIFISLPPGLAGNANAPAGKALKSGN